MKYVKYAVVILICILLQTTLFHTLFESIPAANAVFCAAVCYALFDRRWFSSCMMGLACGVVLDFSSGALFGISSLLCMGACALCAVLVVHFNKAGKFINYIFVFGFSLLYELVYYVLCFAIWGEGSFFTALFKTAIPTALLNTLLSLILVPLMRKLKLSEKRD